MNTGIVILCRYQSTRLPGKILREICGRTVLGHIVDRIERGALGCPVVVATSTDSSDDPIAQFCRQSGIPCFRGDLHNVAGRFLACAQTYGWDYAVRINGDNLFADPGTLSAMLAIASTDVFDFITNVPGRTFPYGMSVEIIRVSFYQEIMAQIETSAEAREHVTWWLYQHEEIGRRFVFQNRICPESAGLQLALDTEEDLHRASSMIARAMPAPGAASLSEVTGLARNSVPPTTWKGRHGPLLIAEIGGNHEGNFKKAMELAGLAAETGVDCIKFQLYRGDTLVSPVESPDRNAHFKRFELTRDQHVALAEQCRNKGVEYLASVWDLDMLDWIDPYLSRYKIGSGDLTAWPLLKEFARRGKPIILATGLATLDDVWQTVRYIQSIDRRYKLPEYLCLLQCTSMYPIPDEEANLSGMDAMRAATGLSVGYSDHTEGGFALRVAAAMGARVLEFHFTDCREGKTFRDHKVSLTPEEVVSLQSDLARIVHLLGNGIKQPQPSEVNAGHVQSFRRAVYPSRNIPAGTTVGECDFVCLRPNHGVDARNYDELIGKMSARDLTQYKKMERSWFT